MKSSTVIGLETIADTINSWIEWNNGKREEEGLDTPSDTHMMSVPAWPTHGQLENWVTLLRKVSKELDD